VYTITRGCHVTHETKVISGCICIKAVLRHNKDEIRDFKSKQTYTKNNAKHKYIYIFISGNLFNITIQTSQNSYYYWLLTFSWLGTCISIKSGGVKRVVWAHKLPQTQWNDSGIINAILIEKHYS
jgi:hypothetical protein